MSSTTSGTAVRRMTASAAGAADGPELLGDKLRIPQPGVAVLRRSRVIDLLARAAAHRVTVVSGPAGAGKTVACASWAAATPAARRVAWLTLDEADRDPARFWTYVRAALARAAGVRADFTSALQDAAPDEYPLRVVEAAQLLSEPLTLVLDDVHELADGPVLGGLDLLLRHAPPTLRLILSGRCPPRLALARLRVSGDLADVSAPDLAATADEADAYFAMLGLDVDAAARDELLRRTEGWMAGLRLAAMTVSGQVAQAGRITGIAGDEPLVTDYLWDEVLGRQPPEIRLFMLRTSVTEQMSGDLADALTGEPGGARTLERLSRENSFVESLGEGHAAYRYHPLLRDVLAAERNREIPHEVPILLRRAARWHASHDRSIDALRAAARAGDWDYAAHMLAEAGTAALVRSGATTLEQVLALFPAERRADDAAVAAALAAAGLWNGDTGAAAHHLDAAQRALGRCAPAARRIIEPWLAALRVMQAASLAAADPGLLAQGWALAEQAQATAGTQPEHRTLGLLWFALGTARLRRSEIQEARYALSHACRQLTAGCLGELCARARGWQALAEAWYGDLTAAEKALGDQGVAVPWPAGQTRDPAATCLVALASAQVSLARDDLAGVRKALDDADEYAASRHQLPGEPSLGVVGGLIRARAALADGDATGARGMVLRLRDTGAPGDPDLDWVLNLLDGEIALHTGDAARARLTLGPDADGPYAARADSLLMRGRLLLSDGDFKGALEAVAPVLDGTADEVTFQAKLAAVLAAAVANRRLGLTGTAAEMLEQALALAEPDDACRVFLDAGQPVRSAITVLVPPTSRSAAFAGRILERFATQLPHADAAPDQAEVLLTASELAVLRFLPSHLTNQEIAEALFLSINTVKTHLRSAYRKLGVASRRAAIARARRLDLL
ncbi:MAG TPA: LuxR C-terminal-related transcriptional regulator [Streptosporangiaceae bacterium]|nr:LuxR C-terminal-related transcriptional regulator [Streptosporangiaceae bacterium]